MTDKESPEQIVSTIWGEEAEPADPFAAARCICSGYDVYGDLLGKARWVEYLYLLLTAERPSSIQADLLERLAIAVGNPGPRDYSVRAAMAGAVGGSGAAASLMAALGVAAGFQNGAREVMLAVSMWHRFERDIYNWVSALGDRTAWEETRDPLWAVPENPPGFNEKRVCPTPVLQTLKHLAEIHPGGNLDFLLQNRFKMQAAAGFNLGMSGVAAAALSDLNLNPPQAEMLYLFLRLPGAMAHALEQFLNWKQFPFYKGKIVLPEQEQTQ
jgi:citrate synthase